MKGKNTISTFELFELFPDQESARIYLEGRLWPEGVRCSCCGSVGLSPEAQAGREKEEGQAPEEMTTGVKYVIPLLATPTPFFPHAVGTLPVTGAVSASEPERVRTPKVLVTVRGRPSQGFACDERFCSTNRLVT
jgi:hypothetical protein